MPKLRKISLIHFKSFLNNSFSFTKDYIGITGNNGKGKTNLLDAIYYSCFTKSYFTFKEKENVFYDKEGFRIDTLWKKNNQDWNATCRYDFNKKQMWINGKELDKNIDYIGNFHAIMIAPDDINILNFGSDLRRKFIDGILAQKDNDYLHNLITYQRVNAQKNAYLKQNNYSVVQNEMLDVYDTQLANHSRVIINKRMQFMDDFPKIVQYYYEKIANTEEKINIIYDCIESNIENLDSYYKKQRFSDLQLKRTTKGIHSEDWIFLINEQPVKRFASQGQKKSFLLALKFAQWKWLLQNGINAILLLDDIFEKLDQERIKNLFSLLKKEAIPQVFFTHPNEEEIAKVMHSQKIDVQIINL